MKPKVLILSTAYLPHIGGSELAIKNITDRIYDFDFDLVTARLDHKSLKHEIIGNVSVFRVGGRLSLFRFFLPKSLLPFAVFLRACYLIRKNQYKLVHAFQLSGAAGAGWLLKLLYPGLPFLVTMQEGKDLEGQGVLINFFRKLIIKKADIATAISYYLKNYILKVRKGLNVEVIPNGVDVKNFSRQFSYGELTDLENRLGIKPDDRVVISVSRLVAKNGVDLLIEAIYKLTTNDQPIRQDFDGEFSRTAQGPEFIEGRLMTNYKLLIVGDGPLKESLKFKVENLKLEDKTIFTGSVKHEELPKYLKISDVFVRPSRSEGLGSAFLEAMAAGIPIIGTKVGGIPDFLEDPSTGPGQATGLFCSPDPEDIASKINIIFENSVLRNEIIKNAHILIEEKYDWDKIAQQYKEIFKYLSI